MLLFVLGILFLFGWLIWVFVLSGGEDRSSSDSVRGAVSEDVDISTDDSIFPDEMGVVAPAVEFNDLAKSIKSEYKSDLEFQVCADEVVQSCLSRAIHKKVATTGELEYCDDFLIDKTRTACRISQSYQLARINKDATYCTDLDETQRENCLVEVATVISVENQDLTACDNLTDAQKVVCVNSAATRLANTTGEASWCDSVDGQDRDFCVQEVEFRAEELASEKLFEAEILAQQAEEEARIQAEQLAQQQQQEEVVEPEVVEPAPAPEEQELQGADEQELEQEEVEPTPDPSLQQ